MVAPFNFFFPPQLPALVRNCRYLHFQTRTLRHRGIRAAQPGVCAHGLPPRGTRLTAVVPAQGPAQCGGHTAPLVQVRQQKPPGVGGGDLPSGGAGFESTSWAVFPPVPRAAARAPELEARSLRVASAGAGSDGEQMLAILNPLFNSLRQLFPIPKVGGIRIKFIPELNTHIHTHTPRHHLEAKLVSI